MLSLPPTPNQSVWRQFKLTTPNMLPSTWFATGSSACAQWITKSHSSPVHVNETRALLSSSKTLLWADCYHVPLSESWPDKDTARMKFSFRTKGFKKKIFKHFFDNCSSIDHYKKLNSDKGIWLVHRKGIIGFYMGRKVIRLCRVAEQPGKEAWQSG